MPCKDQPGHLAGEITPLLEKERYCAMVEQAKHHSSAADVESVPIYVYFSSLDMEVAGTLSGVPKMRACQLINGLENNKRGIYGGAIGYIGFTSKAETVEEISGRAAAMWDHAKKVRYGHCRDGRRWHPQLQHFHNGCTGVSRRRNSRGKAQQSGSVFQLWYCRLLRGIGN